MQLLIAFSFQKFSTVFGLWLMLFASNIYKPKSNLIYKLKKSYVQLLSFIIVNRIILQCIIKPKDSMKR